MKARWDKFLSKSLAKYEVTEEDLKAADQRIYGDIGNDSSMDDDTNRRPSVSTRTGAQRQGDGGSPRPPVGDRHHDSP